MLETGYRAELGPIYLRGICAEDLDGNWYRWFNDPVVTRYQNRGEVENTLAMQRCYFERLRESSEDVILAIVLTATDQHIGNVGLHFIDEKNRRAQVGIVIGERAYWGKGYSTLAWKGIVEYAFVQKGLHRLSAFIMTPNVASERGAAKAGFRSEGILRDYYCKGGKYLDALIMGCLRHEPGIDVA